MQHSQQVDHSWRNNWVIANWLSAIPLARCIAEPSIAGAADAFLMDFFMLNGGNLFMLLSPFGMSMHEDLARRYGKMSLEMLAGMGLGMMFYNTLKSGARGIKQCYRPSEDDFIRQ